MGNKNKILFFATLVLAMLTVVIIWNIPLNKKVLFAKFTLSDKTGFDLSPGKLTFGSIKINQSASRNIMIKNEFNKKIAVTITSSGDISKNLVVSENNFILEPSESKNITFSINTKGLTEFGDYEGKVIIISKRD